MFCFVPVCPAAELLRQGDYSGVSEEDCNLLAPADQRQRRDYIRLQVPHRGREDPLSVRSRELQGNAQLSKKQGGYRVVGWGNKHPSLHPPLCC